MKHIFLLLIAFSCTAISSFAQQTTTPAKQVFRCPPCGSACDELAFAKAGKCPHCHMELIEEGILKNSPAGKAMTVCFYLQNNVEVLDFAGPMEVFRVAGFKVFTVSATKDKITSQGILAILPDYGIADAPPADVMVFFGGGHSIPENDTAVINWIKGRRATTDYFISVCTGAFIMGKAGILDNLTATTYHAQIGNLQKALPKTKVLSNVRFVDNGNVITTAGISAGIDGALHFVAKLQGAAFAKEVAVGIEYDCWKPNNGLIIKPLKK